MSEYDAGTLGPVCPDCGDSENVRWEQCTCTLLPADGTSCSICDGEDGWYVCGVCGCNGCPSFKRTDDSTT